MTAERAHLSDQEYVAEQFGFADKLYAGTDGDASVPLDFRTEVRSIAKWYGIYRQSYWLAVIIAGLAGIVIGHAICKWGTA